MLVSSRSTGRARALALPIVLLSLVLSSGCARPTATCADPPTSARDTQSPGTVLFVLTAAGEQSLRNGKIRETGYFLGEFYEPYRAVKDAGYDVVFATPDGRVPVVDPESFEADYWTDHPDWLEPARQFAQNDATINAPMSLADARVHVDEFAGVIVPGGQGVMIDLLDDPDLHAIVLRHGNTGRPVGLVCHAPAILSRLPEADNPFDGRRVTSVTGFEEFYIERIVMHGRAEERGISRDLKKRGFRHDSALPGKSRAVRDCNLITSQNPFSSDAFARSYVAALAEDVVDQRCACGVKA